MQAGKFVQLFETDTQESTMKSVVKITIILMLGTTLATPQSRPRPPRPDEVFKATQGKRKPPHPIPGDEIRPSSIGGFVPPTSDIWHWPLDSGLVQRMSHCFR